MFEEQQRTVPAWSGLRDFCVKSDAVGRLKAFLRGTTKPQLRRLKQLETLSLGPKRALYLVECDGERFLIAGGADGVSAPVALKRTVCEQDAVSDPEAQR